jgi:AraC-like DNA-binding protein
MEIAIKNMVCSRCIKVVKEILNQLAKQAIYFKEKLLEEGFDIVEDQKLMTVEKIKNLIIDRVYDKDLEEWNENLSAYLSDQLHKDYSTLSQLFSSIENTTIEQYFILQKIERVKEMLVYDNLSLSEIAWKLGYSSVAHLSAQFKKITGFTPTAFKELKGHKKQFIDRI